MSRRQRRVRRVGAPPAPRGQLHPGQRPWGSRVRRFRTAEPPRAPRGTAVSWPSPAKLRCCFPVCRGAYPLCASSVSPPPWPFPSFARLPLTRPVHGLCLVHPILACPLPWPVHQPQFSLWSARLQSLLSLCSVSSRLVHWPALFRLSLSGQGMALWPASEFRLRAASVLRISPRPRDPRLCVLALQLSAAQRPAWPLTRFASPSAVLCPADPPPADRLPIPSSASASPRAHF